jgi:hypothetical protein
VRAGALDVLVSCMGTAPAAHADRKSSSGEPVSLDLWAQHRLIDRLRSSGALARRTRARRSNLQPTGDAELSAAGERMFQIRDRLQLQGVANDGTAPASAGLTADRSAV